MRRSYLMYIKEKCLRVRTVIVLFRLRQQRLAIKDAHEYVFIWDKILETGKKKRASDHTLRRARYGTGCGFVVREDTQ